MSVPVHKRTESALEYKTNFYKIYDTIFYYTTKDFGIKTVVRDLKTFTNNAKMSPDDAIEFKRICSLYGIDIESTYPMYILEFFRNEILNLITTALYKITAADSVFPGSDFEFNLRKQYQHEAIGALECILQLFQRIIHLYPVNEEKYTKIVENIVYEIELLRKWKKKSNTMHKAAQESIQRQKLAMNVGVSGRVKTVNGNKIRQPFTFTNNSNIKGYAL